MSNVLRAIQAKPSDDARSDEQQALAVLERRVAEAAPDELPDVMGIMGGALERMRTLALARMTMRMPPPPAPVAPAVSTPEPDQNLSAREAARRLGVSRGWVYQRVKTLPFTVRLGGRVLFSARGIEKYIRQRTGP